jgi:NADPH-dependent ferric siderophore reductase
VGWQHALVPPEERLITGMSEPAPAAGAVVTNDPFAQLTGSLADTTRMSLEVVENALLTPHMQRIVLTAPELARLAYRPGQDVMFMVDVEGGRPVRRRYTIRALDPAQRLLTLNVVRHGEGPGEAWVRSARSGDRIEGIGPRGKIFVAPDADWHLFAADESGLAAVFAMAGSLPASANAAAIVEVPEAADEQGLDSPAPVKLRWLRRDGGPAGDPSALAEAVAEAELPPGNGHAYLFGEAKVVLALREVLAARGIEAVQISPKAYWGRGRANAQHGEPAKDN